MPIIGGRFYANPAFGEAMEKAREHDRRMEAAQHEKREGESRVHRIHIQHHADGIKVRVLHHAPGSDEESVEPSGRFTTHHFEHGDHEGVGRFVARTLAEPRYIGAKG